MKFWLIADTHLGHDEMTEFENHPPDFSNRILRVLHKTVQSDDVLIHIGDICIGNEAVWHNKLMSAMPARVKKWLILGNHDKRTYSWYLNHGWAFVGEELLLKKFGAVIMLTHKPIEMQIGNMYAKMYGNKFVNIHGHIHHQNRYNYVSRPYHHLLTYYEPGIITTVKTAVRKHFRGFTWKR